MAAKKEQTSLQVPELEDGFDRLGTQIDGWFKATEAGQSVTGRIANYFELRDESKIFLLELMKPCNAIVGKGDDAKVVQLEKGKYIAVRQNHTIREMAYYVQAKAPVIVTFTGIKKLDGNRTLKVYDVQVHRGAKRSDKPSRPTSATAFDSDNSEDDDDNTPF